jgi:uncharacterized protein (TIGR03067 family)
MRLHILAGLAVVGLIAADLGAVPNRPTKKDKLKIDIKTLQGTWVCVASEFDGQQIAKETVQQWGLKLVFKETNFTTLNTGNTVLMEGTYKLDPAKKPKTIEFVVVSGQSKGETQLGIYELSGDTLKLCCSRPGKTNRPAEFTTKANTGHKVTVFKRVKS